MKLFKYVVPERVDVLEKRLVRFTHPRALNDLFELRPSFDRILEREEAQRHLEENPPDFAEIARMGAEKAYTELPASVRSTVSLAELEDICRERLFSEEGAQALDVFSALSLDMLNSLTPKLRTKIYDDLDEKIGVLSLTESWNNEPMWAHYAGNHTGFLIEFDAGQLFVDQRRSSEAVPYRLHKVEYKDHPGVPRSFRQIWDSASIFLTKQSRWAYEQEYRMLAPLADATTTITLPDDVVHLYSIPPEAIRSVTFGVRSTEALVRKVRGIVERAGSSLRHLGLKRAVVDDDLGSLRLIPASS